MPKFKKTLKTKKIKKRNNTLSYSEFIELTEGFSDEEFNRFCGLLSNLRQKREEC